MLICNGKHQYQAKEDLEAFLGNRTVEFVSWYPEYETLLISCNFLLYRTHPILKVNDNSLTKIG